jgi:hypothetical protein
VPGVDVGAVVQRQHAATITSMQDLTRLKRTGDGGPNGGELSWSLVLESMRYQLEAEVRWLDHCEAALARAAGTRPPPTRNGPTASAVPHAATTDPTGAPR